MTVSDERRESVQRLSRDLARAGASLSEQEARFLVDAFYLMQDDRKRAHNQVRAMTGEPHSLLVWLAEQSTTLESQIKRALDSYTDAHLSGVWMKSVYGVGPIIAAGMLAHIDINRAPTVGHVYSFAGIAGAGQKPWIKGQKRPFNAALRTLCWKVGQCFMKFSNQPECVYGALYREQKGYYASHNDAGDYAATAATALQTKKIGKDTDAFKAYSSGRLPLAQIDARARRYAVKRFLSHLHCILHWQAHRRLPPNPYALDHLGHAHFVMMPNIELVPGLREALQERGMI